jgi:hypothetical protein
MPTSPLPDLNHRRKPFQRSPHAFRVLTLNQ